MKKLFISFTLSLTLFVFTNIFAQEQINVQSLTITKSSNAAPTKLDLKAVGSAGQPVNYLVQDATVIFPTAPYLRCNPCSPPKLFNTNVFENPISTQISQSNIFINFYLDSSYSSPIYFGNLIFSRKSNFSIGGSTELKGKLEIVDLGLPPANRIIAFDNDVELTGRYTMGFYKPTVTANGKMITDFRNVEYKLFDIR